MCNWHNSHQICMSWKKTSKRAQGGRLFPINFHLSHLKWLITFFDQKQVGLIYLPESNTGHSHTWSFTSSCLLYLMNHHPEDRQWFVTRCSVVQFQCSVSQPWGWLHMLILQGKWEGKLSISGRRAVIEIFVLITKWTVLKQIHLHYRLGILHVLSLSL